MTGGFRPDTDRNKVDALEKKLEDIIDSQIFSDSGNDQSSVFGGFGARNAAYGDAGGNRSSTPSIHTLTKTNTPAGEISVRTQNIIVDHATDTTLNIYWLDDAQKDGQIVKIKPKDIKTLVLKSGGNIDISADVTIADTEYVELIFWEDADPGGSGKWLVIKTGTGSGGGLSEPLRHTVKDYGDVSLTTESITADTHNVFRLRLTGDIGISISQTLPILKFQMLHLILIQDGTGGHEVTTWDSAINGIPAIDTTVNGVTTVSLFSIDQGTTWYFVSSKGGVLGFSGNLSDVTIDANKNWNAKSITNLAGITFGATGPFADSGFNKFANDQIMLSARNIADDGNLELKVDSGDFFDFTESNNGPVSIKLRAQHASDPDNTLIITQLSGSTGVGQFFSPNQMSFLGSGSANVFNYDQNRIETNVNINPDADGTINLGNSVNLRYLAMHAASFKFDTDRRLDFNIGGGGITVDGVGDSFTLSVDSVTKLTSSATSTILAGAVDITGITGINDKAEFAEITAPAGNPSANTGWMYGKLVSGHTEPFWKDETGTVTNLLAAGGSPNQIIQGDTDVTISDTGAGSIVGTVDSNQKFNVTPTAFNIDDDVVLGLLATDKITFNGKVDSDLLPNTDGSRDLGGTSNHWNDVLSETFTLRGLNGKTSTTERYVTADSANIILQTVSGDGFLVKSASSEIFEAQSDGTIVPKGDIDFSIGDTVDYNASQSTVGSAGAASSLPSNPTGYVVIKITGTEYVVPYYAKT